MSSCLISVQVLALPKYPMTNKKNIPFTTTNDTPDGWSTVDKCLDVEPPGYF